MRDSILHTPDGVRDIYGSEYAKKAYVEENMKEQMRHHGFCQIATPTFEYFDIFNKERGTVPSKDMYKFIDRDGETLVLRPDITPQIARCIAKYNRFDEEAIKLFYHGNTFVNNSEYQGKLKEVTQIGAELVNDGSEEADASMAELMIACLKSAGLKKFRVDIGSADFFRAITDEAGFSESEIEEIKALIVSKNYFAVTQLVEEKDIPESLKQIFAGLSEQYGGVETLRKMKALTENIKALKSLERLEKIYSILEKGNNEIYVSFDLGMLNQYNYYTGVIFQAYTYKTGDVIAAGGRYDNLLSQFGKDAPAIGIAVYVDPLVTALTRQETSSFENEEKSNETGYITFALAKGRLATKTLEILEKIGITCEEMKDEKTRKLIFVNEEQKLKFFLAKATDVPTYVEYGAADIGVVGKDTILEEDRDIYEVMDLGIGKCRMCVAGPESAREVLNNGQLIRVATKYPNIAKEYFHNKKNQTVDIIKLNGSIELAPIVGLSEVIVDIVETGTTLKENGLKILEEVCTLYARVVVNSVSMKMEHERIAKIIKALRELKKNEEKVD